MSTSIFSLSTLAARTFEPATFEDANAIAVLRVIRWFAVAAAAALALAIALGWVTFQAGLAVYHWTERFDSFAVAGEAAQASEPTIEQLAAWAESVAIEWPAEPAGAIALAAPSPALVSLQWSLAWMAWGAEEATP
jgi:hypothetical protein